MSLSTDLLESARNLVESDPTRPKQTNLRLGISAAYYSLFHLLVGDGARLLSSGAAVPEVRAVLSRGFSHQEMKEASSAFSSGAPPGKLMTVLSQTEISESLRNVAIAFRDLQSARHVADYDVSKSFTRSKAVGYVFAAEQAFNDWNEVRGERSAKLFLFAMFAI